MYRIDAHNDGIIWTTTGIEPEDLPEPVRTALDEVGEDGFVIIQRW